MPLTYEPIATTTLGSAATSITFSSITSAYTDLRWVLVSQNTTTFLRDLRVTYNSDNGTNYSATHLTGDASSPKSGRYTTQAFIRVASAIPGTSSSEWSLIIGDILSYTNSTNKTTLIQASMALSEVARTVGLYRSTSTITSVTLNCEGSNNFNIGTTATLYGILKA